MTEKWISPRTDRSVLLAGINGQITDLLSRNPGLLPNIRQGRTMIVASDYAGDSKSNQVFSFLFTDNEQAVAFEALLQFVRREIIKDKRSMSFKRLREGVRSHALLPFLDAANSIHGLSVTVVFDGRTSLKMSAELGIKDDHGNWKPLAWERMLRIVTVISFFVAGLSKPGQNLLWISDNDDIASNDLYRADLERMFKGVSQQFLRHQMGEFQFQTTGDDEIDTDDCQFEDYAEVSERGRLAHRWQHTLNCSAIEIKGPRSYIDVRPF